MGEINDRFGITADVVFPCVAVQSGGNAGAFCGRSSVEGCGFRVESLGHGFPAFIVEVDVA